jgi:hypothetical protein
MNVDVMFKNMIVKKVKYNDDDIGTSGDLDSQSNQESEKDSMMTDSQLMDDSRQVNDIEMDMNLLTIPGSKKEPSVQKIESPDKILQ